MAEKGWTDWSHCTVYTPYDGCSWFAVMIHEVRDGARHVTIWRGGGDMICEEHYPESMPLEDVKTTALAILHLEGFKKEG